MYHPLGVVSLDKGLYDPEYDLSAHPESRNPKGKKVREAYVHLMHCADKPMLVSAEDYRSHAFMFGFKLQKLEAAAYTGMNLKIIQIWW